MNDTLPKGWISDKLTKIIYSVKTGVPEFKGRKDYYSTGSVQNGNFISEGSYNFNDKPSRANRVAMLNDVFQARMKGTDKGFIIDNELNGQLFSTGFLQFRPYRLTYEPKLIYYFIISPSFLNQRDDLATGSTQEALTDTKAVEITIPLPPLNEQKRIVSKLDAIIPRIEAVKQRLEKVPNILKLFRQSVLTAAVTGKLTEKWREEHPEMRNTEVLSDKSIKLINKSKYIKEWGNFEVPYTWLCAYLGEVADLRLGKMLDGSKNKGEKIKYLRNVNVRWFKFNLSDLKEIKITKTEKEILSIKNGDIFICEGGEPGRAAVWKNGENAMTFQKALHRVRFRIPFESDFLVYNLKVDAYTQKLNRLFTGSTIKHLTGRSLALYPITFPPIEEQKEIVKQVEKLFAWADKVEAHYQKAKEQVDKLTQSVLAKAFRGELVPQDPNDEPAEKLLERILKEKAKMEMDLKAMKKKVRKKL